MISLWKLYELCKLDDRCKVAPAMLLDDENNLHRGISVQEMSFAICYIIS